MNASELRARREHRAMIDGMMIVSAAEYIVYGRARGLIGSHRSVQAARANLRRDMEGCAKQGGYSDAKAYCWDAEDGWSADATDC
jgi:hypothetical protein